MIDGYLEDAVHYLELAEEKSDPALVAIATLLLAIAVKMNEEEK